MQNMEKENNERGEIRLPTWSETFKLVGCNQGRRQKIFQGGGATKKISKISKKYRKQHDLAFFRGESTEKKTEK